MKNANVNLLIFLDKFARRGSHPTRAHGVYLYPYIHKSSIAVLQFCHKTYLLFLMACKFNLSRKLYYAKGFNPFLFSFSKHVRLHHKRQPYFTALQQWRIFAISVVQTSSRDSFEQRTYRCKSSSRVNQANFIKRG